MTKHVTLDAFKKPSPEAAPLAQMFVQGQHSVCALSHYAAIVDAQKDVEVYQLGDVDCPICLRRMVEKHEALADVFRARLALLTTEPKRCRVYDTDCINPSYCNARDACCAGDPDCQPTIQPLIGKEVP